MKSISDWYEENWGVECTYESRLRYADDRYLLYFFKSFSVPPLEFVKNIARLNPDLCFFLRYKEDGCALFGGAVAKGDRFVELNLEDVNLLMLLNAQTESPVFSADDITIFSDSYYGMN
jgi:hypothetical protein